MKKTLTAILLAPAAAVPMPGAGNMSPHRHPTRKLAGAKPGVIGGSNVLLAGAKPGIVSGSNDAAA